VFSTVVATNGNCTAEFVVNLGVALTTHTFVTATATDPDGNTSEFSNCVEVVQGVTGVEQPGPAFLSLQGIQPSPSRGEFDVEFSLADGAPARLTMHDLAGRRVLEQDVSDLGPGRHSIHLGVGTGLPAGFYLIRLTQGVRSATARCMVIR
jgi:hypothetical protein